MREITTSRRPTDELSEKIALAAERLAAARLPVVFTGAGVSRESGIPTFRDPENGLWARYDPTQLATLEAYLRQPELVWRWYEHRFGIVAAAEPNPGHRAIARMETLLPQLPVITQNVDGLHQRAGSSDVIELHGTMHTYRCVSGRHTGFTRADLANASQTPPRCPHCGSLLRPDVVWFGEALPPEALERAFELARSCDYMLVVGTSGVVQPAASIPVVARSKSAFVVEVNPEPSALTCSVDVFLQGPSGEILPRLVEELEGVGRSDA